MSSHRFAFIFILLWSANAFGGALYAVKQTAVDTILVRIDPESLALTEIGPLRTGLSNGGLAWDPLSQTLYMLSGTNRAELFTVDLSSGEASSVAPIGRPRLTGITYDCIRDLIYAVDWDGGLTHIDPSNGAIVGGSGASDPEGDYGFNGLGYNQYQDILVGIRDDHRWDSTGETEGDLYSIEWHIGGGKTLLYGNPQPEFSANGLAYDPENNLYWSVNQYGELYSFDPADDFQHTLRGSNYGALLALAYVHDTPCIKPPGPEAFADTVIESNVPDAHMGLSVAGAGDVNGDGFDDVIVASRRLLDDPGLEAAFVYHGSANGVDSDFSSQLGLPPNGLEPSVAGAGDVNGDGYDDVMVSAPNANTEEGNTGAVFIFHGSPSGVSTAFTTQLTGERSWAEFGRSIAGAGDVNGDGFDDVIVGSRRILENDAQGAAFVFYGSSTGIDPDISTQLKFFQDWAEMGYSVAGAGDVNKDGFDDVIVGAPVYDDEDGHQNGAAFVFHGSASGISTAIASQLETTHSGINLGLSVSGAGDIDADGYADVIVGAPRYDDGLNKRGAAFIYQGSAGGITPNFTSVVENNQDNAQFGESVSSAGDVNGDGFADLIVGARLYDLLKENEGIAFIYLGSASGVETFGSRLAIYQGLRVLFGASVAGAGDVNGDNLSDVIVGATGFSNPENGEGGAFVFHSDFTIPKISINAGHSGAWFNPQTPGQGQLIDVEPDSKFLFLSWFTFTGAGSDNPNEQHWFTAQGNYSDDTADLVVYQTLGGQFDAPQEVSNEAVGSATLSFSDCGTGQLDYTIDAWNVQGSIPLQRAISGTENVCQERAGLSSKPLEPNDGRDGAWYDPATPGQGFLIDAHPGTEFIFVAWFTYGEDTASGQRWLTAQGPLQGSTADLVVYETLGGSFDDPDPSETNAVGTMTIDFSDCSHALLNYSITDEALAGMIDIERAIPGTEAICEELTQ